MPFSFRDPTGFLTEHDGRIIRFITREGFADLQAFLRSDAARKLTGAGRIVRTDVLDETATARLQAGLSASGIFREDGFARRDVYPVAVEHERVGFQSFPYEWPPEMLHAAARLTLDIAENILDEGFGLKDASPFNLLFRGPRAVFIDLLSFERRDPADPTWLPEAQFARTFLLPLLVAKHFRTPAHQLFLARREGLDPEDVYRLCSTAQRFAPPFLTLVSIPTWLARKSAPDGAGIYAPKRLDNPAKARFILEQLFKRLRRQLAAVAPDKREDSAWSDYMTPDKHFTRAYFDAKHAFVAAALKTHAPRRLLDVGCNTGHFSRLAAEHGAGVVAVDADAAVVGEVWRQASQKDADILPLVLNLTQPSPATGWRNAECASFIERARGFFDAVLMLSVVHHMLVGERVPLALILELAADLTTDLLVVEYIPPADPMFRRIARGRDSLFTYLTREFFEQACRKHFEIMDSQQMGDSARRVYLLRKKRATNGDA
ncbi:MAG TPA: methyltransferase domain-containing protein [Pyrinomonadaceae bacterium]|jgi:2-polyprenyl-3-methyl-5-hydroxy-6-metoxy-1,4-benzoquinol methylase|nr:methyltransferase domain-containing protein [Pyrinomonadaceae bacterium]